MDLASPEELESFLAHHGVKGQKWGVRKEVVGLSDLSPAGVNRAIIAVPSGGKRPSKKERNTVGTITLDIRDHLMRFGGPLDKVLPRIDKKYDGQNLMKDSGARKKYNDEIARALTMDAQKHAPEGVKVHVDITDRHSLMVVGHPDAVNQYHQKVLQHISTSDLNTIPLNITRDVNGFITKITFGELSSAEVKHEFDSVEDFLAHHGVKGQKWGVKKAVETTAGTARGAVSKTVAKTKAHPGAVAATRLALANPATREEAAKAAKTAFTVTKLGVMPIASLSGIGFPVVAGMAVSVRILADPNVRHAVVTAGKYLKDVATNFNHTPISVASAQHRTMQTAKKMGLPKKRDGGLFNPNAKIDNSQIIDRTVSHGIFDDPALSHMRSDLSSIIPSSESSTKKTSSKGPKGPFTESMVKRDGNGKFAKKATTQTDAQLDSLWLDSVSDNKNRVIDKARPTLEAYYQSMLKVHSVKKFDQLPKKIQKDALGKMVDTMNFYSRAYPSPSGKRRLEFSYDGKLHTKIVANNGDRTAWNKYLKKQDKALQPSLNTALNAIPGLTKKKRSGGLFNPNAKIDNSQIIDRTK